MKIQDVISAMRKEEGWHAVKSEFRGKVILARQFGVKYPKHITLVLTYSKGGYTLEHPNYEYINRISHFRALKKEIRLSLNKIYLYSIIRALKRAGIWPLIQNQNFLKVNTNNQKSNKRKVRRELAAMLS